MAMTLEQSRSLAGLRRDVTEGQLTLGEFVRQARQVALGDAADGEHVSTPSRSFHDTHRPEATAILSSIKRRVSAVDGGRFQVLALAGSATIDFTCLRLDGDELLVDASAIFGSVKLIVPRGIAIVVTGSPMAGTTKDLGAEDEVVPGAPMIAIRAAAVAGTVKVIRQ